MSNAGLWKVVPERFPERPGRLTKGVLFHQDNPAHKSVVAMAAVHDCGFELVITLHILLIWHHLTIFCSPTWKNTWSWEAVLDSWWGHIYSWRLFQGSGFMRASLPWEAKHCNIHGRSLWTAGETMLKNKSHLVKFDLCIIVSQPMNISAHFRMYSCTNWNISRYSSSESHPLLNTNFFLGGGLLLGVNSPQLALSSTRLGGLSYLCLFTYQEDRTDGFCWLSHVDGSIIADNLGHVRQSSTVIQVKMTERERDKSESTDILPRI